MSVARKRMPPSSSFRLSLSHGFSNTKIPPCADSFALSNHDPNTPPILQPQTLPLSRKETISGHHLPLRLDLPLPWSDTAEAQGIPGCTKQGLSSGEGVDSGASGGEVEVKKPYLRQGADIRSASKLKTLDSSIYYFGSKTGRQVPDREVWHANEIAVAQIMAFYYRLGMIEAGEKPEMVTQNGPKNRKIARADSKDRGYYSCFLTSARAWCSAYRFSGNTLVFDKALNVSRSL